ncbi:unnamed protein product [Spodoptera littoralis]|uniref:DUF4795 domain-containing protein n=1 Tax=Spodoptera littoralis TaxID=7109 RepID=A0A9P0N7L7_SPOLI|nr:unnamed protein product [Spodoptera littoralis]CAH1644360.1 unnamed protein product [Spodoptera littoralis]
MVAVQLSARLEAAEKKLGKMQKMVNELGKRANYDTPIGPYNTDVSASDYDPKSQSLRSGAPGGLGTSPGGRPGATFGGPQTGPTITDGSYPPGGLTELDELEATDTFDGDVKRRTLPGTTTKGGRKSYKQGSSATPSVKSQETTRKSLSSAGGAFSSSTTPSTTATATATTNATTTSYSPGKYLEPSSILDKPPESDMLQTQTTEEGEEYALKSDYVTYNELDAATQKLYDNLLNILSQITTRTTHNAEIAYKLSINLDAKIEVALAAAARMSDLEDLVKQYSDQINALDTGLSSQMTNYQEQISQMQHDLETGLENMAERLGNTGGDTAAVTELNSHFTALQVDFENMLVRQKDLKDSQNSVAFDLENLWKEIEMLRDTKSDREEVTDALRDKAGIGELNGLVSLPQFDAVRGEIEKRIGAAYDKFNNQETVWQKAIDDLIRDLNEKADIIQVESLRDEIAKYINKMKERMQFIEDIVGDPKSAMLSKKLFRDAACLSCGSPAHMDQEEPFSIPALPKFPSNRQPGEGAEAETTTKGGGDHEICYKDFVIPHPRDPRSHICQRYCGGSHTLVTEGPSRIPPGMLVQQSVKPTTTIQGTDGKTYLMDEEPIELKIPCKPCNKAKSPFDRGNTNCEIGDTSMTTPEHDMTS